MNTEILETKIMSLVIRHGPINAIQIKCKLLVVISLKKIKQAIINLEKRYIIEQTETSRKQTYWRISRK